MNCKEWEAFLKQENHSDDLFDSAERDAKSWFSCAVGCRLQEHLGKTGVELQTKGNTVLLDVLTYDAEHLGVRFYNEFDDVDNEDFDSEEATKIFNQIQKMPIEKILDINSKLYKQLRS